MNRVSKTLEETGNIAEEFTAALKPGSRATVVGLYGDLGSGKTTFTQAAAKSLGIQETVTSPTFVIEKIYLLDKTRSKKLSGGGFSHLIHIDAYRLEKSSELLHLGWNEITANPSNLIFIEWPERIADILPADMKKIQFTFIDETTREINA